MDVWRITVAVVRRWYVFLPLLALTLLAALQVGAATPTQHEVSATAILVAGSASAEEASVYGGRSDTAQVLVVVLDAPEVRDTIEAQGLVRGYEVRARDNLSIINFSVLGDTRKESLATVTATLELARQELTQRQTKAGVPPAAQIKMQVLQAPHVSEVVAEGKLRNMAVVGVGGAALSLLAAILFDDIVGLFRRWSSRSRGRVTAREDDSDAMWERSYVPDDDATTFHQKRTRESDEPGPGDHAGSATPTSADDDMTSTTPNGPPHTDPVRVGTGSSRDGHP